jgi:hypothetical protein
MTATATLRRATRPGFLAGEGTLRYFTVPVTPGDKAGPTITLRRAGSTSWSGCIRADGETVRIEADAKTLDEAVAQVRTALADAVGLFNGVAP